jgi:hypothetical protein
MVFSLPASIIISFLNKPGGRHGNGMGRADMFTKSATRTFISDHRIFSPFKLHGHPLYRTALITASAEQGSRPLETFRPINNRKPHTHLFNGNIMKRVGWTNGTAAHTEVTGRNSRVYFRGSGNKGIKAGTHYYAVKDADLGTLPALQATGKKFLFSPSARRS